MSKKSDQSTRPDDDIEERAGDDESEDEGSAAPSRGGRARARVHARDAEHGDSHGESPREADEDDDAYWWAPHAVMSALVLAGVFGFFGMFNKALGPLADKLGSSQSKLPPVAAESTSTSGSSKPSTPSAPAQAAGDAQKDMFGAKHLLVMYKGSRRAPGEISRSKEEAKTRADEAAKKAKGGTKFEDVVKDYSDEPGAGARGGDLGKFPKGAMVPEFQTALEKLKVGEVSDVVESPFGYHVILRTQ